MTALYNICFRLFHKCLMTLSHNYMFILKQCIVFFSNDVVSWLQWYCHTVIKHCVIIEHGYVCLGFYVPFQVLYSYRDVKITGDGFQFFHQYSGIMIIEQWRFLTVSYLYCDTGQQFMIVISENMWPWNLLSSVWQWSCHYIFLTQYSDCITLSSNIYRNIQKLFFTYIKHL